MGRFARLAWIVTALVGTARAGDVDSCIDASEAGQVARDKGQFRASKARFQACAREACPGEIRKDCAAWLEALERRMPSLVVRALDAEGREVLDASVTIDGAEVAGRGIAVELDPGDRRLHVTSPGRPPVDQTVRVVEGERARVVEVRLPAAPVTSASASAAPPPPGPRRVPVASYALGGAALLAAGGYLYFGLHAKREVDDMRATCAPSCDADRVDAARRERNVATALFVLSAASLGGALALALGHDAPATTSRRITVGATPRGASAAIGGSF